MNVKCNNCGKEDDVNNMIDFNTGRVQYLCWECYKIGHGEAHIAEYNRGKRILRYEHIKKHIK